MFLTPYKNSLSVISALEFVSKKSKITFYYSTSFGLKSLKLLKKDMNSYSVNLFWFFNLKYKYKKN